MAKNRNIDTNLSDEPAREEPVAPRVTFGQMVREATRAANKSGPPGKAAALHNLEVALGDVKRAGIAALASTEGILAGALEGLIGEL